MANRASRLTELLAADPVALDRVLAVVASVDPAAPSEDEVVAVFDALGRQLADGLAAKGAGSGGAEAAPGGPAPIEAVLAYVYGELGFVGNVGDYYNPDNSLVHKVLEHRRGIPLTLAMVGAEIGRRVGAELSIVGLPGHVVLGDGPEPTRWFDPFAAGAELDLEGCRQLFGRFHPIDAFDPAMTRPIPPLVAAARMLGNLKLAYRNQGDLSQMVKILEMSAALPGASVKERLELAGTLVAVGRTEQAAEQHQILARLDPNRADAHRLAAAQLLARRN